MKKEKIKDEINKMYRKTNDILNNLEKVKPYIKFKQYDNSKKISYKLINELLEIYNLVGDNNKEKETK